MTSQKNVSQPISAQAQQIADESINSPLFPFMYEFRRASDIVVETRAQLVQTMRYTADRLTRRAEDIEALRSTANALGEVQDSGREIDRLCAKLDAAYTAADKALAALNQARKLLDR